MEKRKVFRSFIFILLPISLLLLSSSGNTQERKNPFIAEWDDSIQQLKPGDPYSLTVKVSVPEGHFIYQEKTALELSDLGGLIQIGKTTPPTQRKKDPFTQKEMDVYAHDFEITVKLKVPDDFPTGRTTLKGEVRYQGCSQDFCYRPVKTPVLVPIHVVSKTSPPLSEATPPSPPASTFHWGDLLKVGQWESLLELNAFALLALSFLAGVLTDFTPCVLPIIPLTLAVIGIRRERTIGHNFLLSLTLVCGMAFTYSVLGLGSAFLGLKLGFLFQSRYFLAFLVLFFIAASLAMFEVLRIELPLWLRNAMGTLGGSGYRGAFLAGLSIGFVASPCVGPIVGPLLIFVAKTQQVLFAYGLGMGSLFLLGGTFYSTLGSKLRGGGYTQTLKKALATFMLAPALYYGYVLYAQGGKHEGWHENLTQGFSVAQAQNKPVIIDFYADWCLPCKELDWKTFASPEVKAVWGDIVGIKIDCTLESQNCSEAVNRYGVIGWPTILFLDKNLQVQEDLSVLGGFVEPQKMRALIEELKRRG